MENIPKKQEKLLKTAVLLNTFVKLLDSDASLIELNDFLEQHNHDLYYKINLDDYIKDNLNEEPVDELNTFQSPDIIKVHSDELKLKSLYDDLSSDVKKLSAKDLDRNQLNNYISRRFDFIGSDLNDMEMEINCINYFGDEFNITLDGRKIDDGTCPVCGEDFYIISELNPCPKCGKKAIEYNQVFYD